MSTFKIIKNIVKEFRCLYTSAFGIDPEYGYGYLDSLMIIAKTEHDKPLYDQIKSTEQDFSDEKDNKRVCHDLDGIVSETHRG